MKKLLPLVIQQRIVFLFGLSLFMSVTPLLLAAQTRFVLGKKFIDSVSIGNNRHYNIVTEPLRDGSSVLVAVNEFDLNGYRNTGLHKVSIVSYRSYKLSIPNDLVRIESVSVNDIGTVCIIGLSLSLSRRPNSPIFLVPLSSRIFCQGKESSEWRELKTSLARELPLGALKFVEHNTLVFSSYQSTRGLGPDQICKINIYQFEDTICADLPPHESAPAYYRQLNRSLLLGSDYFGNLVLFDISELTFMPLAKSKAGGLWFIFPQATDNVVAWSGLGESVTWDSAMGSSKMRIEERLERWAPYYILGLYDQAFIVLRPKGGDVCIVLDREVKHLVYLNQFQCEVSDDESMQFQTMGNRIIGITFSSGGILVINEIVMP